MKKYLPWMAVVILFMTLMYAQHDHREDQQELQDCYRVLLPEAKDFEPLDDGIAAARDASGSILAYVGVKSATGYGGPMLVGIAVHADGTMGTPVIFTHRETQAYLDKIEQQGFFKQFETLRADDALVPGFDIDGISGATLSSHAIALAVNEAAHAIATQAMNLTPRKAELPWRIGVGEISIAALFALGLIASTVKKLARFRLLLLGGSIVILGFWLNRSFSLAHALAACMGFFPDITRNLIWYIVVAGAVLPTIILGKNLYCTFICPFCGLQELTVTLEGVSKDGQPDVVQQAFMDAGAVQCGFCIPGMILTAEAFLKKNPNPTRDEVKLAISGNLCRCTGYAKINDAVLLAAARMRGEEAEA